MSRTTCVRSTRSVTSARQPRKVAGRAQERSGGPDPTAFRIVGWRAAAAVWSAGRGSMGGGRVNLWAEGRQYRPFRLFFTPAKNEI